MKATTLPAQAVACRSGSPYCVLGTAPHLPCSSRTVALALPGHEYPASVLEATIEDTGNGPVLAFCPDGRDAVEFTSGAQLRAVVSSALEHLPRLLAIAAEFDALMGGAR